MLRSAFCPTCLKPWRRDPGDRSKRSARTCSILDSCRLKPRATRSFGAKAAATAAGGAVGATAVKAPGESTLGGSSGGSASTCRTKRGDSMGGTSPGGAAEADTEAWDSLDRTLRPAPVEMLMGLSPSQVVSTSEGCPRPPSFLSIASSASAASRRPELMANLASNCSILCLKAGAFSPASRTPCAKSRESWTT